MLLENLRTLITLKHASFPALKTISIELLNPPSRDQAIAKVGKALLGPASEQGVSVKVVFGGDNEVDRFCGFDEDVKWAPCSDRRRERVIVQL